MSKSLKYMSLMMESLIFEVVVEVTEVEGQRSQEEVEYGSHDLCIHFVSIGHQYSTHMTPKS